MHVVCRLKLVKMLLDVEKSDHSASSTSSNSCSPLYLLLLLVATSLVAEAVPTGMMQETCSMVPSECPVNIRPCTGETMASFNWEESDSVLRQSLEMADSLIRFYDNQKVLANDSHNSTILFQLLGWELAEQDLNTDAEQLIGRAFVAVSRVFGYLELAQVSLRNDQFEDQSDVVGELRDILRDGFLSQLAQHCNVESMNDATRDVCRVDVGMLLHAVESATGSRANVIWHAIAYDSILTARHFVAKIHEEFVRRAAQEAGVDDDDD